MAQEGFVSVASRHSAAETVERLLAALKKRDLAVFARIDHAAAMEDQQRAGIDLPLKALVWQDAAGKVWLSYNTAEWIAARAGLGPASADAVSAMTKALAAIAEEATG
jgi:uncharacterized protein (DUF302 family)